VGEKKFSFGKLGKALGRSRIRFLGEVKLFLKDIGQDGVEWAHLNQ
jgi:hypothetical protein